MDGPLFLDNLVFYVVLYAHGPTRERRAGRPEHVDLAELAKELGVARYQLSEWVRLGLLPAPIVLRVRKNGRATAYGFPVASLPEIRERVALLRKGGLPWPKSLFEEWC